MKGRPVGSLLGWPNREPAEAGPVCVVHGIASDLSSQKQHRALRLERRPLECFGPGKAIIGFLASTIYSGDDAAHRGPDAYAEDIHTEPASTINPLGIAVRDTGASYSLVAPMTEICQNLKAQKKAPEGA